jgi:hypothetical protein
LSYKPRTRGFLRLFIALLTMVSALTGQAHEGHDQVHARGIVESVDARQLRLTDADGGVLSFDLDQKTRFENSGKPGKQSDLVRGIRVVVHATKHGEALRADDVHYRK